jgi:hypothetical protein
MRFCLLKVEDDACIFVGSSVEFSHGARDFWLGAVGFRGAVVENQEDPGYAVDSDCYLLAY